MMNKRLIVCALAFVLLFSCVPLASANSIAETRASQYLHGYTTYLARGSSSGDIRLEYIVSATGIMSSLGISQIVVYKSNGTYVTTINGSISNGLFRLADVNHSGYYIYHGTPGTSYYFVVTVFAGDSTGSDSRTVTTNTVQAPA